MLFGSYEVLCSRGIHGNGNELGNVKLLHQVPGTHPKPLRISAYLAVILQIDNHSSHRYFGLPSLPDPKLRLGTPTKNWEGYEILPYL